MAYIEHSESGRRLSDTFLPKWWATRRPTSKRSGTVGKPPGRQDSGELTTDVKRDIGAGRAYLDYSSSASLDGASPRRSFEIADKATWQPR